MSISRTRVEEIRQHALKTNMLRWFSPDQPPPGTEGTLCHRILDELTLDLAMRALPANIKVSERELFENFDLLCGLFAPLTSVGRLNQQRLRDLQSKTALFEILDFWRHHDAPRTTWRQEHYPLDDSDLSAIDYQTDEYLEQPARSSLLTNTLIDMHFAASLFLLDDRCQQDYGSDKLGELSKATDALLLAAAQSIYRKLRPPMRMPAEELLNDVLQLERAGLPTRKLRVLLDDAVRHKLQIENRLH